MAKGRSVESTLSAMGALKGMGSAAIAGELQKHLGSKTHLIVAKAADLIREAGIKSLQPQLEEAFWRFMRDPTETDEGCGAKQAIANALYELGCDAQDVFLKGIRHVQMEGTWGKSVDVAAELRGICALGLVRMAYRDVMNELIDLLADESHQSRIMAARAIAYAGRDEGAGLLRLKILLGDLSDEVTGECLIALGGLSRKRALDFIARYLRSAQPILSESAAIALGEMRDDEALDMLLEHLKGQRSEEERKSLLLPIALSRLPRSLDFLLTVVETDPEPIAAAALEALRMYRHDEAARLRVSQAVIRRKVDRLTVLFERLFA